MRKVKFAAEELMMVSLFRGNSRMDTIQILENMMKELMDTRGDGVNDDLVELVDSTVGKLRMIGDTGYKSLDLDCYAQHWKETNNEV